MIAGIYYAKFWGSGGRGGWGAGLHFAEEWAAEEILGQVGNRLRRRGAF